MTPERKQLRERISEAWREHVVLTRTIAEAYLARYPDDGLIWAYYGDSLRALGAFSEARTALQTARGLVEREDTKIAVLRFMAELDRERGDYRSAEQLYREAAELEPEKGCWLLFLGGALRRQGRDDEAEACYRKALTLDGDRDEYLLNLGFVLQARGDLKAAAACFEEALTIDHDYEEALDSLEDVRQALAFLEGSRRGAADAVEQPDAADERR